MSEISAEETREHRADVSDALERIIGLLRVIDTRLALVSDTESMSNEEEAKQKKLHVTIVNRGALRKIAGLNGEMVVRIWVEPMLA